MRPKTVSLLLALLLLSGAVLDADPVRDFWFSGAELNRYELSQTRYGENHPGHAEFIFVTEPFLTGPQVKDETGEGESVDVFKLNALRTFNTGIYSYRTMTSTFQPLDLAAFPHSLKTNTSVQDWCGQTFQQLNKTDRGWRGELRSYFQKEGDADFELPEVWIEDELWLRLRLDPSSLPTGSFSAVPGALFTRFQHLPVEPLAAEAEILPEEERSRYVIRYPAVGRTLEIEFDSEFPHIIRAWEERSPAGTTRATLTHRLMNQNYWSENQPRHAKRRELLGLEPVAD